MTRDGVLVGVEGDANAAAVRRVVEAEGWVVAPVGPEGSARCLDALTSALRDADPRRVILWLEDERRTVGAGGTLLRVFGRTRSGARRVVEARRSPGGMGAAALLAAHGPAVLRQVLLGPPAPGSGRGVSQDPPADSGPSAGILGACNPAEPADPAPVFRSGTRPDSEGAPVRPDRLAPPAPAAPAVWGSRVAEAHAWAEWLQTPAHRRPAGISTPAAAVAWVLARWENNPALRAWEDPADLIPAETAPVFRVVEARAPAPAHDWSARYDGSRLWYALDETYREAKRLAALGGTPEHRAAAAALAALVREFDDALVHSPERGRAWIEANRERLGAAFDAAINPSGASAA